MNQRDFRGVVTAVELGAQPPEVTFVRSANSPCDGVVCYNIGLNLCAECAAAPGIPYVQMEVKVPGYSNPWVFRMKLLALDITVQLYFWSSAPEGRGSGRPYSLIEAALCPEPAKPHLVKVALETISHSPIFESVLSRCEPVASAVICSHVLPRFTGFQNRVILEEGQAVAHIKKTESAGWQQNARRAGWQPRAEAAVESVKALVLYAARTVCFLKSQTITTSRSETGAAPEWDRMGRGSSNILIFLIANILPFCGAWRN